MISNPRASRPDRSASRRIRRGVTTLATLATALLLAGGTAATAGPASPPPSTVSPPGSGTAGTEPTTVPTVGPKTFETGHFVTGASDAFWGGTVAISSDNGET